MKIMMNPRFALPFAAVALTPSLALAHSADGAHGLLDGAVHPLTGLDHVLAMIAVGVLAVRLSTARFWLAPAAFVAGMASGLAFGGAIAAPTLENAIAVSVIVLGILLTIAIELPLPAGLLIVAAAGFAHGGAHALEGPAQTGALTFAIGALVTTALLHAAGIGLAFAARGAPSAFLRTAGAAMAAVGASMLVGV